MSMLILHVNDYICENTKAMEKKQLEMNSPELEYVRRIATDVLGEPVYFDDDTFSLNPSFIFDAFIRDYPIYEFPFSEYEFMLGDSAKDIRKVLEVYNLDLNKFWYLVAFVYYYTIYQSREEYNSFVPYYDEILRLHQYFENNRNVKVILRAPGESPCEDRSKLFQQIISYIVRVNGVIDGFDLKITAPVRKYEAPDKIPEKYMIWFAYNMFMCFFDRVLHMQDRRYREKEAIRYEYSETDDSYGKDLLISRLVYFMTLTSNEAYTTTRSTISSLMSKMRFLEFSPYHFNTKREKRWLDEKNEPESRND